MLCGPPFGCDGPPAAAWADGTLSRLLNGCPVLSYDVGPVLRFVGQIAPWISPPSRHRPLASGASAHPTRPSQCPPERVAAALDSQADVVTEIEEDRGARRPLSWS